MSPNNHSREMCLIFPRTWRWPRLPRSRTPASGSSSAAAGGSGGGGRRGGQSTRRSANVAWKSDAEAAAGSTPWAWVEEELEECDEIGLEAAVVAEKLKEMSLLDGGLDKGPRILGFAG